MSDVKTRREDSWPLSTHLVALALAIMMPLLGLAALALLNSFDAQRKAAYESTQRMADGVAESFDREVGSVKTILNILAQDRAFDRGEFASLYEHVKEGLKGRSGNVALVRPDNTVIFYTRFPFATALPLAVPPDGGGELVAETLRPVLTDLFVAPASQTMLFATVAPIIRNGALVARLHFTLEPSELAGAIATPALLPGGAFALADGSGKTVLTNSSLIESPERLPEALLAKVKGVAGVFETSLGGQALLVSYRRSQATEWTGFALMPISAIDAPLDMLWRDFLLTGAVALALSLAAAYLFSRRMTQPMHELVLAVSGIGLGENPPFPHSTLREANLLAGALGDASAKLQTRSEELRQSERRFRLFAERTPDAIWFLNVELTQMDYVSPAFETIWGRPTSSIFQMSDWIDTIHPADAAAVIEQLQAAQLKGGQFEYRIVRPDGAVRWVRDTRFLLQETEGQPRVIAGIVRDFTTRKEAVDALEAAQMDAENRAAELEHIYANAPIGLAVIGRDYRLQQANGFIAKLAAHDAGEQVGQLIFSLLPAMQEKAEPYFKRVLENGESVRGLEFRAKPPGAEMPQYWYAHLYPIQGTAGTITGIGLILEDITEQKLDQRELARLAAIVYAANDAMFSSSPNGIILNWNPAAETLFQYLESEAVGRSLATLFPNEKSGEYESLFDDLHRGESSRLETELLRKDGALIAVSISVAPIRGGDETIAASITIEDISERKRSEARQLLMNRELAHRVKNSLAVIQAMARHTLRSSPSPEAFASAFEGRLQALATSHNLLTASHWEGADLRGLVSEQLALSGAGSTRLKLRGKSVKLPPGTATSLGLVLHELATNAVKYGAFSNAKGRVEISWTVKGTGNDRLLHLDWREIGGPPVSEPGEKGFGSTLIEYSGNVTQHFNVDGLCCSVEMAFTEDAPPKF